MRRINIQYRQQFRDLEKMPIPTLDVNQAQIAAAAASRGVRANNRSQSNAVDIRHTCKADREMTVARLEQSDEIARKVRLGFDGEPLFWLNDEHIVGKPLRNLHDGPPRLSPLTTVGRKTNTFSK